MCDQRVARSEYCSRSEYGPAADLQRLPTYLANREYRLFDIVMQHIDCLFVGRRQILAQTHSEDELARVMRECVSRLVKCNVAQGLEVIVRSLKDGSVMVVDRDRVFNGTSWMSGITCYVYQVQVSLNSIQRHIPKAEHAARIHRLDTA